jgi:hypothetical protein
MWLLMVTGCIIIALTYSDYGVTWDEGVQSTYGERAVKYFSSGFERNLLLSRSTIRYCGTLAEMIPALVYGSREEGRFEKRHFVLALLALLVVPGLFVYGRRLDGPLVPIFAVLALAMMPRFYGHIFANSKDIPFAVTMVWFMVAATGMFARSDFRWRALIICAAAMGLVLCVRPSGAPLVAGFLVLLALLYVVTGESVLPMRRDPAAIRRLALRALVVIIIAWAMMVALWPWAHENVIANPLKAMSKAARFPVPINMLFEGRTVHSSNVPRLYLVKYLLITTPPTLMLLALFGMGLMVRQIATDLRSRRAFLYLATLMWLFVPIVAFIVFRPRVYDGMRHFFFLLPALALTAAVGAAGLPALVGKRTIRWLIWPLVIVTLLLPLKDQVRLHPYQATYFNALVGGLRGAYGSYETDYWASSYREAMLWVNERAARRPEKTFRVVVGGDPSMGPAASYYAAANVKMRFLGANPEDRPFSDNDDYFIATTRFGHADRFPDLPVLHRIGRDGAVFTVIKGRAD